MTLALIALAVLTTEASAQSTTRPFYNSKGQSIGRSTTIGNTTTFYDSRRTWGSCIKSLCDPWLNSPCRTVVRQAVLAAATR